MSISIKFKEVGQCIYCGRKNVLLSDEHIVGVAIGGNLLLPKASCKRCSKITGKLEGHCFRGTLRAFRVQNQLAGRRAKEMPQKLPLTIVRYDGRIETKELPKAEYPAMLIMPKLIEVPTILTGQLPNPNKTIDAWGHMSNVDLIDTYKESRIGYVPYHSGRWLRMLAKIAHSYAVAKGGINGFKPLLPKLIKDFESAPTHYIGCLGDPLPPKEETLHRLDLIKYKANNSRKYLIVNLRLFANFGAPQYHIVVGEL